MVRKAIIINIIIITTTLKMKILLLVGIMSTTALKLINK